MNEYIISENMELANFLRYCVIFLAFISFVFTVAILIAFVRRVSIDKKYVPDATHIKKVRLHITGAAIETAGWVFYGTFDIWMRFNQPLRWRTPFLLALLLFATVARFWFFLTEYREYQESEKFSARARK